MASVFKRGADKRDRNSKWMISYKDERGRFRVVRGCADRQATEELARKLESDATLHRRGVLDPAAERFRQHAARPIDEHFAEYLEHCKHAGHSPMHVANKRAALRALLDGINAKRLADLEPNAVERHLRELRNIGRSARTVNDKRAHAVALLNWAVTTGRAASNPLRILPTLNEDTDRRRVRRALSDDELSRLLAVAGERKAVYLLAARAGLRRGELKGITWADVDLSAGTLRVRATIGKAKRDDELPLHPDAAAALAAARPVNANATGRVFPRVPSIGRFYKDLQAAGIPREDAEGRVLDLHALRTTLGTGLARAGIVPQIAMKVMRHANVKTTLKHYTDLRIADAARAVAALPALKQGEQADAVAATGTDASASRAAHAQRARRPKGQDGAIQDNSGSLRPAVPAMTQVAVGARLGASVQRRTRQQTKGLGPSASSLIR